MECQSLARRKSVLGDGLSPSQDRHRALHFKSSPSPLAWKDAYRQKCIQRLRTGREKLLNRFRDISVDMAEQKDVNMDIGHDENQNLRDMMREEWRLLTQGRIPVEFDFEEEELRKMMDDVEAELMSERDLIWREYELCRADEEAELCAVVDDYLSTRDDDVLCPICMRGNLSKLLHNVIVCQMCGLRLDLEADNISMTELKNRLVKAVEDHDDCQSGRLTFAIAKEQMTHCQNLTVFCNSCDYWDIVV